MSERTDLKGVAFHTFRLRPGEDLYGLVENFVREKRIQAGCILTCVSSLTPAVIRLANRDEDTTFNGHFEIVSLGEQCPYKVRISISHFRTAMGTRSAGILCKAARSTQPLRFSSRISRSGIFAPAL